MKDTLVIVAVIEIVRGHRFLTLVLVIPLVVILKMATVTVPQAECVNPVQMETVTPTHPAMVLVVRVDLMEIVTKALYLPYVA